MVSNPLARNENYGSYGLACTKAGVSPLQGESGGFDSLRVHKVTFTGYKRDAGSIPVLRGNCS